MKYFTKELWLAYNSEDDEVIRRAIKKGQRSLKAYFRQLERLKPRLSPSAAKFFGNVSLHDGRLLAFVVGDQISYDERSLGTRSRNKSRPEARMDVLDFEQMWLHRLRYSKVRRVLFDFPSAQPLFHEEGGRIDDWGYDELTAAGKLYLRHEVLFSSGAMILIEFQKFSYKRTRVEGGSGPVF